jgi:hypothetical protein
MANRRSNLRFTARSLLVVIGLSLAMDSPVKGTLVAASSPHQPPFEYPDGLAIARTGALLIVVGRQRQVFRMTQSGEIRLVAGSGRRGFGGDGGPGVDASLDYPSEAFGRRICRVDSVTGHVSRVAGTGVRGIGGNGGPAVGAELYEPISLVRDPAGNLYFIELYGRCVRKIDIITKTISVVYGYRPGVCEPAPPQP